MLTVRVDYKALAPDDEGFVENARRWAQNAPTADYPDEGLFPVYAHGPEDLIRAYFGRVFTTQKAGLRPGYATFVWACHTEKDARIRIKMLEVLREEHAGIVSICGFYAPVAAVV